ncbi:tetratricopeptide repeat protein [Archangium violaceum]|uniref:tetratricopeptide repeat protein n=1 Tax=Archangium violaceum TaxID=83451 RepID=UPI00193C700E|nr:tetratricopeptide repeat protein [Archangium violaceum]QRK04590.1 tetratricopeptide repeat protein [Archangium violaceum]
MSSDSSSSSNENAQREKEAGEKLIRGEITLGEFLGMPTQVLYRWAETAHNLLQAGSTQQALQIFQGLVAAAPYDSVFHCQLAATYMTLERYDEAFEEFSQSLRFNGSNVDALVGRGEIHLRRGNVPEGLVDFTLAVKKDPELKRRSTQRARSMLLVLKQQADQAKSGK